jgi:2-methylisocitrate lyase-like PEP mutase family enzyme
MTDLKSARQRFKSMHDKFFVIPNAWNVGEVRKLEKLGFGAVATTSAGLSASMGREDLSSPATRPFRTSRPCPTPPDIEAVVKAVAPKPVNILIIRPDMSAKELEELGVRRMSIGGFLAAATSIAFEKAADGLRKNGTLPKEVFG